MFRGGCVLVDGGSEWCGWCGGAASYRTELFVTWESVDFVPDQDFLGRT